MDTFDSEEIIETRNGFVLASSVQRNVGGTSLPLEGDGGGEINQSLLDHLDEQEITIRRLTDELERSREQSARLEASPVQTNGQTREKRPLNSVVHDDATAYAPIRDERGRDRKSVV